MSNAVVLYPQLSKVQSVRSSTIQNANLPPVLQRPAQDTMAPASQESTSIAPARPVIARFVYPNRGRRALEVEIIHAQNVGSQALQEFLRHLQDNFKTECVEYQKASREAVAAYQDFQEKTQESESWTFFRRVISYAGSAAAVVLGAASGGSAFGYIVLASGAFNITREFAKESGLIDRIAAYISPDDRERAESISNSIQVGSAILTAIPLAISGVGAVNAIQGANAIELAKQIVTTTTNIGTGLTTIIEGRSQAKTKDAQVHSIRTQQKSSEHRYRVKEFTDHVGKMAEQEKESLNAAKRLVKQNKNLLETIAGG